MPLVSSRRAKKTFLAHDIAKTYQHGISLRHPLELDKVNVS